MPHFSDWCEFGINVSPYCRIFFEINDGIGPQICLQSIFGLNWNGSTGRWEMPPTNVTWPISASIDIVGVDSEDRPVLQYNWGIDQGACVASGDITFASLCQIGQILQAQDGGAVQPECCGLQFGSPFTEVIFEESDLPIPISDPPKLPEPCSNVPPDQCCTPPIPGDGPPSSGGGGGGGNGRPGPPGPKFEPIVAESSIAKKIGGPTSPPNVDDDGNECCDSTNDEGGGGCSSGMCISPQSSQPIRYATGELMYRKTDLLSNGFAEPWGHTRRFMNRLSGPEFLGNGYYWSVNEWPYLVIDFYGNVTVVDNSPKFFTKTESGYEPAFDVMHETLDYNSSTQIYTLTSKDGTITELNGANRMFKRRISPGGQVVEVTSLASNGFNPATVQRTDSGSSTTEQFVYSYSDALGYKQLASVTLQRKVGAGDWENILRANYTYYGDDEYYGIEADLKTVTTQEWDGSSWNDTGTTYYRYYGSLLQPSSSSSGAGLSSSSSTGPSNPNITWGDNAHMLKYIIGPAAYARLSDDPSVTNPLEASDSIVMLYADNYFEYDASNRVTKEIVQGGSQTFLFSYSESENADGYNSWKTKTTETLPDGNQNIVFSNYIGQPMLNVFKSGSDEWISFRAYDSSGRTVLDASPSAVTTYDENDADLLGYNSGDGTYDGLRDSAGLIYRYSIDPCSGYPSIRSVQEGQLGSTIKVLEYEYSPCPDATSGSSSSSSSFSSGCPTSQVWFTSKKILFPSDTNQALTIETSFDRTYYSGTCQLEELTVTLPVIPTDQNGSGVAASRKQYFDIYGNLTWQMDERGFITRTKFDIPTRAVTQLVQDVDTSVETDGPSGWVTPSGGGLNLVTDLEHDDQGRTTQVLGPSHSIDISGTATTIRRATWMVYDEDSSSNTIRVGRGYATGTSPSYTYTLVNPVSILIADKNNKLQQQIQATRASTPGKLDPTDTFAQSSYTRWRTIQYTDCCNEASQRVYYDIPSSGDGTEGTNYNQTRFGYDTMKRRNRTVSPGGTITRFVFDARGLTLSSWMGTDDNGATSTDPTGGGAPGNNMVIITGYQYDSGNDGGNGNLTQKTDHVDGSNTRVTSYTFDFRNRRTETDGEVDYFEKHYYDNLNRVTKTERYDTTSSGNLITRGETKHDDRNRIFRSIQSGVDPSTGTVGNSLTSNYWFDDSGRPIKSLPAGSALFTKTTYDSLGRSTKVYRGYDLDESTYAEATTVTGDTIMEQSETSYDDVSNLTQVTIRQRYHDAPASQTGELQDPSTTPKARVTYVASWPDAIGRQNAVANYGTYGGSSFSRPSVIPSRSDAVLVTSNGFDEAGNHSTTTDPAGMVTKTGFDDQGRQINQIMNYSASSSSSSGGGGDCEPSDDVNVSVQTAYNADGNVSSVTAVNSVTGNQTTQYVYGSTLTDSDVASSLLKVQEIYPDSTSDSDTIKFTYNRQRQHTTTTDQQGTVHSYDYDKLGRQTQDRVTTLGSGVDDAIRRIAMTYEVRGMREKLTSYDSATVGSGNVVNETQFAYNDFSQLAVDYQAHGGSVNTSTSPKVQYSYENGSNLTIRSILLTYPDGRELTYGYGSANGMNDALSRIESIVDDDGTTHLSDYSYLGLGSFVVDDHAEPEVKWTMADLSGSNDPDTGDIYSGLDRFGRIKDNRWYDYGAATDVDRVKYGYDQSSNRIWRENTVATSLSAKFDEVYLNDAINRLKSLDRGKLNAAHNALTSTTFAECWSLDPTGNWKKYLEDTDGNGTWDLNQARTSNEVNEITNITESAGPSWATPVYNSAGNMTNIPTPADPTASFTATYDAWNRLVKLVDTSSSQTVSEYAYDGARRRVVQSIFASGSLEETRHYFYSRPAKWQVVEERVDAGTTAERQFVWGSRNVDDLVLRDRDADRNGSLDERLYALQDANWNVDALVNTNGAVQERYAYAAYGYPVFLTSSFGSRSSSTYDWETLYSGYRWDQSTGLFHVRNRMLHSLLGTWIQRDPVGYSDSPNLYDYAASSPISRRDPSGLNSIVIEGLLTACIATGACEAAAIALLLALAVLLLLIALGWTIYQIVKWAQRCRRRPKKVCPPCPAPPPPEIHLVPPSRPHYPCPGDHWHLFVYNQNPTTCVCYLQKRLGGCIPPLPGQPSPPTP